MLLDNNICSSKHVLSAISSLSNRAPLGALENRTKTQNAPIVHIQAAKGARLLKLDMALKTCYMYLVLASRISWTPRCLLDWSLSANKAKMTSSE